MQSEDEEDFIARVGLNYDLWQESSHQDKLEILQAKIKRAKKNHKYKKLSKLKKFKKTLKSEFTVFKLDEKLSKSEFKKLIRKINSDKFHDDVYQVEAVYPNYEYEISSLVSSTNDPLRDEQWALDIVDPGNLWDFTKGEDIVVAVIDTGVDYNHEDLKDNIWVNEDEIANNGIDDDGNGYVDDVRGWDFVKRAGFNCISSEDCNKEDNDPSDVNGHGTHVSGIIAASHNNNIGISGIAPRAKIMPLKAGYSTGFSAFLKTSDIFNAISYAINNDADVINMSFAGFELSVLSDILNLAQSLGIVSVAAAGNNSNTNKIYPAGLDSVISVGATADGITKAYFSNSGTWVDIVAPGSWILSTVPGNRYDNKSGTSMAAPIVSGIVALIKSKNKLKELSASQVKSILLDSLLPTSFAQFPGASTTIGSVSAQIDFPLEIDTMNLPQEAVISSKVTMTASASDPDAEIVAYEWFSDRDGFLSQSASFDTELLSQGIHIISVRAENSLGELSDPVVKTINITDGRNLGIANFSDKIRFKIKKRKKRFIAKVNKKGRKNVQAYKWVSSRDGTVSESRKLMLDELSSGYHQLSLLLQDSDGNWSEAVDKIVQR